MGGSALRGAAFGKPVVIVGDRGFSAPLTERTADSFHYHGIYGIGNGNPDNARLISDIRSLTEGNGNLPSLGAFSRQFVHFALGHNSKYIAILLPVSAAALRPPLRMA
jgi:hypothetical protein